ncbi:protein-L-isoaspartate(D-aspartate) O-methyltransferase [Candidatus Woesearchaeota archaeon]|nr:protein-L-isoaspartate(D-aspartate) O-methyltransferase [Candidatus Woesearchaeota archaeon]
MSFQEQKRRLSEYWHEAGLITDKQAIKAFMQVPREMFVPEQYKAEAYGDYPLPLPSGQTISQPTTVMIITQALELSTGQKVLEVGAGSGYQAAIIAEIVGSKGVVYATEILPELAELAQKNLAKAAISNVKVISCDGSKGYEKGAPYDRIAVSAACSEIPKPLVEQLRAGGLIVAPVGNSWQGQLMEAADLKEALDSGKTVIITANCSINYSGRAESFLADGDRIIIIKSDKTLLVHQPSGSAPINYMKEGTAYKAVSEVGKIVLSCSNNKEFMAIYLNRIHSFTAHELADGQKLQITGSEKDMSVMIYNNPELIEKGFRPLSMEEHTRFGFIDVFGYDAADMNAVEQLKRYVDKVKQAKGLSLVRGIIAAPKITPSAAEMLRQHGYEHRNISPPKYMERFDEKQKRLEF